MKKKNYSKIVKLLYTIADRKCSGNERAEVRTFLENATEKDKDFFSRKLQITEKEARLFNIFARNCWFNNCYVVPAIFIFTYIRLTKDLARKILRLTGQRSPVVWFVDKSMLGNIKGVECLYLPQAFKRIVKEYEGSKHKEYLLELYETLCPGALELDRKKAESFSDWL